MPKNAKFGTKVVSSVRMITHLDFWKKFFNCGKTSIFGVFFLQNANFFPKTLAWWCHVYTETDSVLDDMSPYLLLNDVLCQSVMRLSCAESSKD